MVSSSSWVDKYTDYRCGQVKDVRMSRKFVSTQIIVD